MVIAALDNTNPVVAAAIHGIRQFAYSQEARLLGVTDFPPLAVTPESLQQSREQFLGALESGQLVGVLSLEVTSFDPAPTISSLVVHPSAQRRGVGRALVRAALALVSPRVTWVQTAALNAPAVALYQGLGFTVTEHLHLPTGLELVKMLHPAGSISVAA